MGTDLSCFKEQNEQLIIAKEKEKRVNILKNKLDKTMLEKISTPLVIFTDDEKSNVVQKTIESDFKDNRKSYNDFFDKSDILIQDELILDLKYANIIDLKDHNNQSISSNFKVQSELAVEDMNGFYSNDISQITNKDIKSSRNREMNSKNNFLSSTKNMPNYTSFFNTNNSKINSTENNNILMNLIKIFRHSSFSEVTEYIKNTYTYDVSFFKKKYLENREKLFKPIDFEFCLRQSKITKDSYNSIFSNLEYTKGLLFRSQNYNKSVFLRSNMNSGIISRASSKNFVDKGRASINKLVQKTIVEEEYERTVVDFNNDLEEHKNNTDKILNDQNLEKKDLKLDWNNIDDDSKENDYREFQLSVKNFNIYNNNSSRNVNNVNSMRINAGELKDNNKQVEDDSHSKFTRLTKTGSISQLKGEEFVYWGQITSDKLKQGYGTLIKSDGTTYEGIWINDKFSLYGRMIDTQGTLFQGIFKDGLLNGKGYSCSLISTYKGDFVNGLRHGKGKFEDENEEYIGDFVDDKKSGNGVIIFKLNKHKYEGEFDNDFINGNGYYEWAYGDSYRGEFKNGILHGFGIYKWQNGDSYEGYFHEGMRWGHGTLINENGNKYVGEFKDNVPHGLGYFSSLKIPTPIKVRFENGIKVKL